VVVCFFCQAEDGIRDFHVTGVQTCALPILAHDWIGRQEAMRTGAEEFAYAIANGEGFVGTCGLQAHADGTHEIGYWIGEPYWNKIGRAACRERVEIAVVARLIKTKITAIYT